MKSSAWKMYWKTCYNILQQDKIAYISKTMNSDGHGNWDKAWYWFKESGEHIGRGKYWFS